MLNNSQKAAAYNASARSCAELAPWLHPYNDQVIVDKDTGLLACFEFEGLDTDSVTVGASRFTVTPAHPDDLE